MKHVLLYPLLLFVTVLVTWSGVVNPTMPALSITRASVLALVVSPLLSLPVCPYCVPLPSPCTLGQQVTTYGFLIPSVIVRVLIVQHS